MLQCGVILANDRIFLAQITMEFPRHGTSHVPKGAGQLLGQFNISNRKHSETLSGCWFKDTVNAVRQESSGQNIYTAVSILCFAGRICSRVR